MSGEEEEPVDAADAADAGVPDPLQVADIRITQVWSINIMKHPWQPDTQTISGHTFFRLSKQDRRLCQWVYNKGMNRSAKGERRIISNLAFWPKLVAARREGCNQAIARVLRDAMVTAGEEPAPDHKFRPAKDGDEWLMPSRAVDIHMNDRVLKVAFALRGDVLIELTPENVQWVIQSLRDSDVIDPASPSRKKRRRKRKGSQTPKRHRHDEAGDGQEQQEQPAEDAS